MGLAFIAVHNDAVVVDAVFDKNTSHVQGPWIMTTTNFALSMGWTARFGSFLARCTHFPRNIGMFALIWSCVRILLKISGLMLNSLTPWAVFWLACIPVALTPLPYTTLAITSTGWRVRAVDRHG